MSANSICVYWAVFDYISNKETKGKDGYKVFSIGIKEDTVAQIDDISAGMGHSRNELISSFLEFALKRCVVGEEKD